MVSIGQFLALAGSMLIGGAGGQNLGHLQICSLFLMELIVFEQQLLFRVSICSVISDLGAHWLRVEIKGYI